MKRIIPVAAALAAAALTLTACGGSGTSGSGSSGAASSAAGDVKLVKDGTLTVCSDIPYEPFEYVKDGKNVGFDIDLAQALADKLGAKVNVITTPFEAIESGVALNTNKCDISISGMGKTPERATKFDYTDPYLKDNLALMAKKDSGFKSLDDVKGKKVGVQKATTGEAYAKKNGISPVQFKDAGLLTNSMASGSIDAAIANVSTIFAATQAHKDLTLVKDFDTGEVCAAGVKKGNTALAKAFNAMLAEKLKDGSYDKLVEQWFGSVADAAKIK